MDLRPLNGKVQAQQATATFQQATETPTRRQAGTAAPAVACNERLYGVLIHCPQLEAVSYGFYPPSRS